MNVETLGIAIVRIVGIVFLTFGPAGAIALKVNKTTEKLEKAMTFWHVVMGSIFLTVSTLP